MTELGGILRRGSESINQSINQVDVLLSGYEMINPVSYQTQAEYLMAVEIKNKKQKKQL